MGQVSTWVGDCLKTPGAVGMGLDILAAMRQLWPILVLVCFVLIMMRISKWYNTNKDQKTSCKTLLSGTKNLNISLLFLCWPLCRCQTSGFYYHQCGHIVHRIFISLLAGLKFALIFIMSDSNLRDQCYFFPVSTENCSWLKKYQ